MASSMIVRANDAPATVETLMVDSALVVPRSAVLTDRMLLSAVWTIRQQSPRNPKTVR